MNIPPRKFLIAPLFFWVLLFSCQNKSSTEAEIAGAEEIATLPMNRISLDDLQAFSETGDNWSIAGNVESDYQTAQSMDIVEGDGVLVNNPSGEAGKNLFTELEHGDLELKLEFLVPKGSNSGIYFQGRYETQILDSWKVDDPQFSDVGGIYQRWDDSLDEGDRGYEGSAPTVNAALAPGLWQEYHILFRAPRFDDAGNKVKNARFEWVYLNGVLVQEDVEVTGPTRAAAFDKEVPAGPLMLQGDHGPVAFRNIEYKTYSQTDSITLGEMNYTVYEYEDDRTPVNFDELTVIEEGVTDHFNITELSPVNEHYATTFSGEIEVPTTGEYLFETFIRNGGNLYIDGELLIENTGEYDSQRFGNTIHLTKGTHQLDVTHFQIIWTSEISINYEGPNIEKRPLVGQSSQPEGNQSQLPLAVEVNSKYPELIGGFFNYGGKKRTHVLSVGHQQGVHYSYDLKKSAFLSVWRDPFADVTKVWRGRGLEQLLVPLNAAIESGAGIPLINLNTSEGLVNEGESSIKGVKQYRLNENGQPVFVTQVDGIVIEDHTGPDGEGTGLVRTLNYYSDDSIGKKAARLAQGNSVELLKNGLFRINGKYYIRILNDGGEEPVIQKNNNLEVLLISVLRIGDSSEVQYQIIW